jgi:hypothetical protein
VARAIIKIFTIIFASAVVFSLIKNPQLVNVGINDTSNLVRAAKS